MKKIPGSMTRFFVFTALALLSGATAFANDLLAQPRGQGFSQGGGLPGVGPQGPGVPVGPGFGDRGGNRGGDFRDGRGGGHFGDHGGRGGDRFGDRDRFERERRYRCERAQQQLQAAQAGLNNAQIMLFSWQAICGDNNMMCVVLLQNNYNQAVSGVQNAQAEVNRECSFHRGF